MNMAPPPLHDLYFKIDENCFHQKSPLTRPHPDGLTFPDFGKADFFCCTLSESVAEKIQEYFGGASSVSENHHAADHSSPTAMDDVLQDEMDLHTESGSHPGLGFQSSDSCLSENADNEIMILGLHFEVALPNGIDFRLPQLPQLLSQVAYTPRPQNKSSPPIPLATIRIQV